MVFQFNLDKFTDPYLPRSIVPKLPHPIGRFLGQHHKYTKRPKDDYILWADVIIGTFCGLLTVEGIFKHSGVFQRHHAPILIASYGASAILLFNVNQSPLAQPRNILTGHFISALIGIIILKLFELSDTGREHKYIGAALSTAIASVVMSIFNCMHPPSGATALIPLIDDEIGKMGWWYLPAHLVSSTVIIAVGLITNNILRSYPVYWWSAYKRPEPTPIDEENKEGHVTSDDSGVGKEENSIVISSGNVSWPKDLDLSEFEVEVLNTLKMKLGEREDDQK